MYYQIIHLLNAPQLIHLERKSNNIVQNSIASQLSRMKPPTSNDHLLCLLCDGR